MTAISPPWLRAPATARVMAALAPARPFFVGGCVRDALMAREPAGDVDIAVAVPPEETLRLAEAAGLGAHPTGIAHGVVTVTAGGRGFEIASMRRDVATDGRRAVIAYTSEIAADAARRDFTINALYADAGGKVFDPLGLGLADLGARRLRFVGDPATRISEDRLRALRYFRFHATLGINEFDAPGLRAALDGAEELEMISRERIGAEMMKLLAAPDPEPALSAMGPALVLCLPGATVFKGLVAAELDAGEPPDPLRRL
ncbi:MAG: CCA tRNA nucleotidyltransferase, partial [Pikeienuella sp.]